MRFIPADIVSTVGAIDWILMTLARCDAVKENAGQLSILILCCLFGVFVVTLVVACRRRTKPPVEEWSLHATTVNESLYELHKPEGVPTIQVLFFHGLPIEELSDAHLSTWKSGDGTCIWPKVWLAKEFPDAHILVVSYHEGLRKASAERFDMRVISENLIDDLIQAKIGQTPGCPVILVGHSFGGLVIKQLCWEAHNTLVTRRDKAEVQTFLDSLRGIFYYSTPHHGSADIGRASKVLSGPLLKYFTTLSTDAARLNSDFSRMCASYPKCHLEGLGEMLPVETGIFQGVVVVSEASARDGVKFNVDATADHFSVCRPVNTMSRRFHALTGLLDNICENVKEEKAVAAKQAIHLNSQRLPKQLVNMDVLVEEVKCRLNKSTTVGFVGMGGLGKTTLAKAVFNELSPSYEYTCFVPNVKSITGEGVNAPAKVVWELLHRRGRKVGGEEDWSKLNGQELLLVLDDINARRDITLLSDLVHHGQFSPSSRIIVTSRDGRLVKQLEDVYIYEVPLLDQESAQKLFLSHAFPKQAVLPPNLQSDMVALVAKCGGLPIALEVLGNHLKFETDRKFWSQTLQALQKAEDIVDPDKRLWDKLRISYDELLEVEKKMFLDCTTFFNSPWTLHEAKVAWREAYGTECETLHWKKLVDRCLVYAVREKESIKMHDQLLSLGQKIASEPSNYNGECRVWEMTAACKLLQNKEESGNEDIHALQLADNCNNWEFRISSRSLHKLKKLQYLDVGGAILIDGVQQDRLFPGKPVLLKCIGGLGIFDLSLQDRLVVLKLSGVAVLPSSIGQLSALRIFTCQGAHVIPEEFGDLSKLEHLEFRWCSFQSLPEKFGKLSRLEYLEFSLCRALEVLPSTFNGLSNLKDLKFHECDALHSLSKSFGQLLVLNHLAFTQCESLSALPDSFGQLSALNHLEFHECESLSALPNSFGQLSALNHLEFDICKSLSALPNSFGQLSALNHLEFDICKSLSALPNSFGQLSALNHLEFVDCGSLSALPNSFGQLSALKHLEFTLCKSLSALPNSFGQLSALNHLAFTQCESLSALPNSFGQLSALKHLVFYICGSLSALPNSFGQLSALNHLQFVGCGSLSALPDSFGQLSALNHLEFDICKSLSALPNSFGQLSALNHLKFVDCGSLSALPNSFGQLSALNHLQFVGCGSLSALPDSFGQLSALNHLEFHECESLSALPNSFGQLSALNHLEFDICKSLSALPNSFGQLSALNHLEFVDCGSLSALPNSFGQLSALNHLEFVDCGSLSALPDSFGNLSTLKHLEIDGCNQLVALPDSFGNLDALADLTLRNTHLDALPNTFGKLSRLCHLVLRDCGNILSLIPSRQLTQLKYLEIGGAYFLDMKKLPESLAELTTLNHLLLDHVSLRSIPEFIKSMQSLRTLELRFLPYVKQLPAWLGDCGVAPLALSGKKFQVQDGCFSLASEDFKRAYSIEELMTTMHRNAMEKVKESDYEGALADLVPALDLRLLDTNSHRFLLQERGIVKRLGDDLQGAFQDLTAALEVPSDDTNDCHVLGLYECLRQRGYVNFLLKDFGGAQNDAAKALKILPTIGFNIFAEYTSGFWDETVTYMDFTLVPQSEVQKKISQVKTVHSQVWEKVTASDFLGALAIWEDLDAMVLGGFYCQIHFLQERGILKQMAGNLQGGLEDLTAALQLANNHNSNLFKHRGYIKFLMGDHGGARSDAQECMAMEPTVDGSTTNGPSLLGELPVAFLKFRLKGRRCTEQALMVGFHSKVMEKVKDQELLGALTIWNNYEVYVEDQVCFLQERGILKRMAGDLNGALEDLTAALEIDPGDYECSKHRGYVKFLLGDTDGARKDAERCLAQGLEGPNDDCLGCFPVAFLEFKL